ncbi:hypothetical protein IEE86_16700 [Bacillus sp. 28A-2]|uniref:hypothetical protein n=1 Tax=Bacillus sp. 28A-2 TaxID=2772252 RepID=UPI00168D9048|nr:hypothetical protein [Bacillus sp. 28A-2]MBD3861366.1 hypothetical protein [Bacillus sp. 28A-2]
MIIDTRESGIVKIEGNGDLILSKNNPVFELRRDDSTKIAFHVTNHVVYGTGPSVPFRRKIRTALKALKYIFGK